MAGKDDIEVKVAALGDLSREELVSLWRKNFGVAPPKGVHRALLVRGAAFHLQQRHFGSLSGDARRLLAAAMRQTAQTMPASAADAETIAVSGVANRKPITAAPERRLALPGARLIRDWNGRNHVVDVVENGFIYAGRRYRSLSKIASEITGTNWSGPRFFGL